MAYRVQIRRGTASEWSSANPILLDGEFAIEKDTKKFKIGDGITPWNDLVYATQGEKGVPGTTSWLGITDIPTEFNPSVHDHDDLYYEKTVVDTELSALQRVRIYEGATQPTDTKFWYDPFDDQGIVRR